MVAGPVEKSQIEKVLGGIADPETGRDLVQMDQVKDIRIDGESVAVDIQLATHSAPLWDETKENVAEQISCSNPAIKNVEVTVSKLERPASPLGKIGLTAKSVIAVGSGKGGVGKSTIAASLACALKNSGCEVGLMDADVYGPSVPHLMGISGRPAITPEKKIEPAVREGLKMISMGLLVSEDEPIVWRGPMLHGAITQFLRDTAWGNLDYLIIDMPPGTGDIALTLSQLLPLTGAVVVCTPQDVALLDAVKAIAMFRKVNIPILGMVENMSGFECPDTGKTYDIFGKGGARDKAEQLDVPLLAEVPINIDIRTKGDAGEMFSLFDDPKVSAVLNQMSYQLVKNLARTSAENPPMPELPVL
ncbi:MAG: Mrp/NBP35 family ATP-binding protein [Planctomycetota bacterium]